LTTHTSKEVILITGCAGLVGKKLIHLIAKTTQSMICGIDSNLKEIKLLKIKYPEFEFFCDDLSNETLLNQVLVDVTSVVILHAQINGSSHFRFSQMVQSTKSLVLVLNKKKDLHVVFVGTQAIYSKIQTTYVTYKKLQEIEVVKLKADLCILRPTLLYGRDDNKHLSFISNFLGKYNFFVIPGKGDYVRQPISVEDFSLIIRKCLLSRKVGAFNITGKDSVSFVFLVTRIKDVKRIKALIFHVPVKLFSLALKTWSLFNNESSYTPEQLNSLTINESFSGVSIEDEFELHLRNIDYGLEEAFGDKNES
jgi:nucleoside-diphosphate-sugar epimerase